MKVCMQVCVEPADHLHSTSVYIYTPFLVCLCGPLCVCVRAPACVSSPLGWPSSVKPTHPLSSPSRGVRRGGGERHHLHGLIFTSFTVSPARPLVTEVHCGVFSLSSLLLLSVSADVSIFQKVPSPTVKLELCLRGSLVAICVCATFVSVCVCMHLRVCVSVVCVYACVRMPAYVHVCVTMLVMLVGAAVCRSHQLMRCLQGLCV